VKLVWSFSIQPSIFDCTRRTRVSSGTTTPAARTGRPITSRTAVALCIPADCTLSMPTLTVAYPSGGVPPPLPFPSSSYTGTKSIPISSLAGLCEVIVGFIGLR
jgi:hypothetical protein